MPGVSLLFVLPAFVLTVCGGLVLYALVRGERNRRTSTDRETAERMARRDARDGSERTDEEHDGDDSIEGNHWG